MLATARPFRFNRKSQRWIGPDGQYIGQRQLARQLGQYTGAVGGSMRLATAKMTTGEISVDEWQRTMADEAKSLHLTMTAAAKGGFHKLTQADYGRVGRSLRFHYQRLQAFAEQYAKGRLTAAQAISRSALYAAAGNLTYQNVRRLAAGTIFRWERRILGAAEHCADCLMAAAMGWVKVGTLPPIGESMCLMNCRCRFEFRKRKPADV